MNILITGSEGFIGKNLVSKLILNHHRIQHFDLRCDYPKDICSFNDLCLYKDTDVIIHLAAYTGVLSSINHPVTAFRNNLIGTINLLEFARLNNIHKIVFASSCSVLSPIQTPYSASKLSCENILKSYSDSYNFSISIIRFTNIYGPHSLHKTSVIPTFIKQSLSHKPLTVRGDGSQTRSFVFVDDAVNLISSTIYNSNKFETLTISSKPISILDIADEVRLATPYHNPEIRFIPKENEPDSFEVSPTHESTTSLRQGIKKTYDWFYLRYKDEDTTNNPNNLSIPRNAYAGVN